MNIDLLPMTAFALEASGARSRHLGEAYTLTLRPDPTPVLPAFPAAGHGSVFAQTAAGPATASFRAAVVPSRKDALTLTF